MQMNESICCCAVPAVSTDRTVVFVTAYKPTPPAHHPPKRLNPKWDYFSIAISRFALIGCDMLVIPLRAGAPPPPPASALIRAGWYQPGSRSSQSSTEQQSRAEQAGRQAGTVAEFQCVCLTV